MLPHSPLSTSLIRDAGSAEQARGDLGDLLQRSLGIARHLGNRAQDLGAGGLALPGGGQFALQPGIFLRGSGLPGDRFVVGGKTGLEPLLELGHQPAEVGHHVRRKRGHSTQIQAPDVWRQLLKRQTCGAGVQMPRAQAIPFA